MQKIRHLENPEKKERRQWTTGIGQETKDIHSFDNREMLFALGKKI